MQPPGSQWVRYSKKLREFASTGKRSSLPARRLWDRESLKLAGKERKKILSATAVVCGILIEKGLG
ncbi:MAG: hypothetical protein AB7D27_12865 [Desulfomicrobium sp.]|jgi:hypothetical protein